MDSQSVNLPSEVKGIERVAQRALKTFGAEDKARRWLHRPTTVFSGASPLAVASSGSEGVQKVLDLLNRIDHGLAV